MKTLFPAIATMLLAGCVAPHVQAEPAACPLTIEFGSYAMGIDRGALEAVEALLARDGGGAKVERRQWGREGEVTLCVAARSEAEARRLARGIVPLLPVKPRGPIGVSTAGGFEVRAPAE